LRFALRAPLCHLPAKARVSEALVSFRLARPSPACLAAHRARTTQDASDRLLLPITLSTSTRASSASGLRTSFTRLHPERGVLHGTLLASAGRAPCFDAGRFFPAPRRSTEPLTPLSPSELPRDAYALLLRRSKTLPDGLDRFFRHPRDGMTAPSTRGAFLRQVPEPSTRTRSS